jgi:hypothetical protein
MTRRLAISTSILALMAASPAVAHHPGGVGNTGGSGPIITIPATTIEQGHAAIAAMYEYSRFGELTDATLINAAANHIDAHSLKTVERAAVSVAYGITNDLMVSAFLPYVRRTNIREGHHEHEEDTGAAVNTVDRLGDSAGIGDLTLLGQYRFPQRPFGAEMAVLFGIKTPTGRTNERTVFGELFEAEFQPGSGSWDPMFGFAFTKRVARWSFDANWLYTVATEGTQDTDLGDRFRYNFAVSYRVLGYGNPDDPLNALAHDAPAARRAGHGHTHSHIGKGPVHTHAPAAPVFGLDLILELNGEYDRKQVIADVVDPNSGGHVLFLSPGIRATYGQFSAFASVGIPIVNEVNGLQSEPDYRVIGGVAASF